MTRIPHRNSGSKSQTAPRTVTFLSHNQVIQNLELRTYPLRLLLPNISLHPVPVRATVGVAVPLHLPMDVEEFLAREAGTDRGGVSAQFEDFSQDFAREESEFGGLDRADRDGGCDHGGDDRGVGGCGTAGGRFKDDSWHFGA
jgi:hypothetical protein